MLYEHLKYFLIIIGFIVIMDNNKFDNNLIFSVIDTANKQCHAAFWVIIILIEDSQNVSSTKDL